MKKRPDDFGNHPVDITDDRILRGLTEMVERENSSAQSKRSPTSKDLEEAETLRGHLNPILAEVRAKLPEVTRLQLDMLVNRELLHPSTFKEIVFATYEAVLPRETRSMTISTVYSMRTWQDRLSVVAQDMGCVELKRALHKGLALSMAKRGVLEIEGTAWMVAVTHGLGATFNHSQTLPGYREALKSVKRARLGKLRNDEGKMDAKGISVRKLAPALLQYWLPLGLWAMSVEDALQCLRLFTFPAVISRANDAELEKLDELIPESFQTSQSEVHKIKPKEKKWRGRFSSAVSDNDLHRAPSPMISLRYTGSSVGGRSDPEKWIFDFLPGFNCAGRW